MGKRLVVNFHGIGEPHAWVEADERPYWCSEENFLALLDAIPEVAAAANVPIDVTFDDGNASDLAIAAPALRERGLTAEFFVCAGRIGQPGYLDGAQMLELVKGGMSIGSHGWSHIDWRGIQSREALDREVVRARDRIAETIGGPIDTVAIPFGSYDRCVWRAVSQAFARVCTSDRGLAPIGGTTIPRETYVDHWDADTLRRLAAPKSWKSAVRQRLAMAYKRNRDPLRSLRD